MNHEEIESLLILAEEENKKGNFNEVERLSHMALESIPVFSAHELGKSDAKTSPDIEEDFKPIAALRSRALNYLSESLWRRGMAKEALPIAEDALRLSSLSDIKELEAKANMNLGVAYANLTDFTSALKHLFKALELNEFLGNEIGSTQVTGNIGNIYMAQSNYPGALEYYSKALASLEDHGNKVGVAKVTGNIGIVYWKLSNLTRALEYLTKAHAAHEELGNKMDQALITAHIGSVYSNLSDYPKALEYYIKALSENEKLNMNVEAANVTGNIGLVYDHLCDYKLALRYHLKAYTIHEELNDKRGSAIDKVNIGIVYLHLINYPLAIDYMNQALNELQELGLKLELSKLMWHMGSIYAQKEFSHYDVKKAENYLHKSIALSEEIGSRNYDPHLNLAELYKSLGCWEKALKHFELYHKIEKEVVSEEAKKKADLYEQQKQAAEREKEIEIAKAAAAARMNATTSLLHRVLPESISTRMINGEENISDFFPSVSILFADIEGFTTISADMKAIDVVRFLNHVFGEFDRIMNTHGCEKIKTIGDGYMAMAGAPIECEDHAERLAAAALDMQRAIHLPEDIRQAMPDGSRFGIRIGLHTGSVVAGVIGQERFVYDIHSDAVNIASRMESSGEVGRVHVSSDFAEHLQARFKKTKNATHGIQFEDRGESNIKGKGMMKTYFIAK